MHVPSPLALRRSLLAAVSAVALPAIVCLAPGPRSDCWAAPSPIEAATVSSRTERLLAQVDSLQEDQQWEDALETITLVMDESDGQLVRLPEGRYVPLREACQARLARMPAEVLAEYRRRIDPSAERLLDEGRQARDPAIVQRIIDDYFTSSATPRAVLLLADLAIERGDAAAARRALGRLHPLLSGPRGRPIGVVLAGVDLMQHWAKIEPLLLAPREALPPIYPDAEGALPEALTRLALISLLEQDTDRAAIEAALLRLAAPDAKGVVAGVSGPLGERLAEVMAAAAEWPSVGLPAGATTLGGDSQRTGVAAPLGEIVGPIWSESHKLTPVESLANLRPRVNRIVQRGGRIIFQQPQPIVSTTPQVTPAVFGPWVVTRDAGALIALQLADGAPAVTRDGLLYQAPVLNAGPAMYQAQGMRAFQVMQSGVLGGAFQTPLGPLEIDHGVLYARVGRERPRRTGQVVRTAVDPRLLGFGLLSEGLQVVELDEPDVPWRFSGPPLVESGLVYVALDAAEVRPRVALACYSAATGRQLWFTSVCSGPPAEETISARPADTLTKQGGTLFFNSNLGAIAAVDASSGAVDWIAEYPRYPVGGAPDRGAESPRVSPCIAYRGRLLAAPVDSPHVFALDQASGRWLWATKRSDPRVELLGVRGGTLVAGGELLTGVDLNTGEVRYQWPSSTRSGIRGMGRGCLAGDEVFWPTRGAIYARNAETGAATRTPIDLAPVGGAGANLTPAHGLLVVASREQLTVYGPQPAEPPQPGEQVSLLDAAPGAAAGVND
ncbi:PQQ enzyme repeat protein [Posidoniimonas polymericola]|uniref:PQQ enzyme repeat protein n=1 Tax=Posidoniimonas polymericola TaxID=2528002 RepID=A0A5C5YS33_9BACT|nr:PQQ-binding-like beta-propeller repeat protein [Posidoniimonas polymericola]TWT77507.1 PQQ enzyme repeat protein [Posidoniimonas polymericola]